MNILRTIGLTSIVLVTAMYVTPAFAADEHNVTPGLTGSGAPLGLHGVDPVTFIELGNRLEGHASIVSNHDGVSYYFTTKDSMEKFKKNPSQFTPENGGFCTFGVSVGKKFDGNPKYASVYNEKLYVFLNEAVLKMFLKDKDGTIAKASEQWSKIQHTAASAL